MANGNTQGRNLAIDMLRALTMTLMTLRRFSQILLFQPMDWNMLQKPWLRWSQMATNQTK